MERELVVVSDLDDTLADTRHRQSHNRRHHNWERFFAASERDPVLQSGWRLRELFPERLVVVTGRPARERARILAWFEEHGIDVLELHTRGNDDRRPGHVVKARIVERLQERFDVVAYLDDDAKARKAVALLDVEVFDPAAKRVRRKTSEEQS